MNREVICQAGAVCQIGAFNMIDYAGLDEIDALLELIDNSIDWRTPGIELKIKFIVTEFLHKIIFISLLFTL